MNHYQRFTDSINTHTAVVAVVGLGYVSLPLSLRFAETGFKVIGLDIDPEKSMQTNAGQSYIKHFLDESIQSAIEAGFFVTTDFTQASESDALIVTTFSKFEGFARYEQ